VAATLVLQGLPSATNPFEVVATGNGFTGDLDLTVAIGTAGSTPATFAALGSAEQFRTVYSSQLSLLANQAGISFTLIFVGQPLGAVGGSVYGGVWSHAPAGGDAPLATFGPLPITR